MHGGTTTLRRHASSFHKDIWKEIQTCGDANDEPEPHPSLEVVPMPKNNSSTIASCSIEIFRFLAISIVELKNTHFRRVLPVFWAFPVRGPIIIASRAVAREVMMGPTQQ